MSVEREKQIIFYHPVTETFTVWDWGTKKWVDAQHYAPKVNKELKLQGKEDVE